MQPPGMIHRLQSYVADLGAVANRFDLDLWHRVTRLRHCGVELRVRQGQVVLRLDLLSKDGTRQQLARIEGFAEQPAFSPPIALAETRGQLDLVLESQSEGAEFDLYVGSNDRPDLPAAQVAFVLAGPAEMLRGAAENFARFRSAEQAAPAQLLLIDDSDSLSPPAHPETLLFSNGFTAGAGAMGRGLYELGFGLPTTRRASHVCLYEGDSLPAPELFARTAMLLRFLRPGRMLQPALTPPGWSWLGVDLCDVYRNGLPYPFLGAMAGPEYHQRLLQAGLVPVPVASLPLQGPPASPNVSSNAPPDAPLSSQWALRALRGSLATPQRLREELAQRCAEAATPAAARALLDEAALFLRGPTALIRNRMLARGYPLPPHPSLTRRLRRKGQQAWARVKEQLQSRVPRARLHRRVEGQLQQMDLVIRRYHASHPALTSAPYWSQMQANCPPADPCFAQAHQQRAARRAHNELVTLHLKNELLWRQGQQQHGALEATLAAAQLLDPERVRADQSRPSRSLLSLLRNRHQGARAVIVGNGPSLRTADLDRLDDCVTFASNKIYLAYEDTDWRPHYYSVEDHLVMLNNKARIAALKGSQKIFPASMRDFGFYEGDTIFAPFVPPHSFDDPLSDPDFPAFSDDLSQGICWGSTIVYSQIQMAMHMGVADIVLIGLDHSYQLPSVKQGNQYLYEGERNHFHPDYRAPGERWHQPNLEVLERSYARARDHCAARGVRILNASRQSKLDVFERADFDQLFPAAPSPTPTGEKSKGHA